MQVITRNWLSDMDEYFFWRLTEYFCEWLMENYKRNEVNIKEKYQPLIS